MAKKTTKPAKAEKTAKSPKVGKTTKVVKKEKDAKAIEPPVVAVPGEDKFKIISEFATKKGDTGSPEVQIALLTKRIEKLVGHLKSNPQDNHSRRGLLGMVSKRRRLINYLLKKDNERAKDIMKKLKLS